TFSITDGSTLTVTLTNTSTADVFVPTDVLTAVFFDIQNVPPLTLSPSTAMLAPGSTVYYGPTNGGDVGGEWAYAETSLAEGVSSSGFGLFGAGNFGDANLQGPVGVDGLQYGITSAGDDVSTGNTPVTGGNALIKNSVVFTLTVGSGLLTEA